MLANPVVIPAYADPLIWGIALLAIFAEIAVAQFTLRRFGLSDPHFAGPLFVINICTWFPFLVAVDAFYLRADAHGAPWLLGLEAMVVVVETALLYQACRGRFFSARTKWSPVSMRQAAWVSLLANAVSAGVSVLVPVALFLILK